MAGQRDDSGLSDDPTAPTSETRNHKTLLSSVDPEIVKAVVKPLLGMSALVFLLIIVSFLPGLQQFIPATPITFAALIIALFTLGIVGVLLYVAPHIEKLVKQEFGVSNALTTNAAAIVKHLDVLLAIFVAHWGLSGALLPFFSETDTTWIYDIAFLVLALIPTVYITWHLYRILDPAAELLTRKITLAADRDTTQESRVSVPSSPRDTGSRRSKTAQLDTDRSSPSNSGHWFRNVRPDVVKSWFSSQLGESAPSDDVLTKRERVLQILDDHRGRIQQTEIVELTGWSKSTVSRVLSEMNEEGHIVKMNLGQGNLITLPGAEPDSLRSNDPDHDR